ncbi:acyl-CoA synthetase (AMP-forming)/AMP-acid ligase II [Actinomycetospora succinea]|uniref:Acyl-CoA synthetase (AMP-forming)/AMP-acid ligase II n=1 Tax=Actinomycetospora succinea TaxID=663603 RepID=A0A4R6VHH1_9PSEU|nr:class I adenylate-forming enzyme family protein [Actinomycetospora succinea]TDQ62494.1 acyl-CoA synthetase (AMP-forming)/AMP-acid ligase II [Actinomycetospora succinea]
MTDHADRVGLGPILAELTAPGGEFAMVPVTVDGIAMRVHERGPHTLRELYLTSPAPDERTATVYGDERCPWGEHRRRVRALARWLVDDQGLRPGERLAIAMRNVPEWTVAFWAGVVAGLVVVPLNAWWTGEQLAGALRHAQARVVVADPERVAALAGQADLPPVVAVRGDPPSGALAWDDVVGAGDHPLPDVAVTPDDTATIIYTSGTTGAPKGVVTSHRSHVTNALNVACLGRANQLAAARRGEPAPASARPGTLLAYPMFHIAGLNGLYGAALSGATLALLHHWDPDEALRLIATEQLTNASGVPAVLRDVVELAVEHPRETASLTRIAMGGAPIPPSLVRRVATGLAGRASAANGYGATETTSAVCANTGADYAAHPDSVGRPVPGTELRVVDPVTGDEVPEGTVGELCFRGPQIMRGYWRNEEATAAVLRDGWLHSGDLGLVREGWVYVVDRAKDVIVRGGENVFCGEVEAALLAQPGVLEAAVVGVPHPRLGEDVAAVLVAVPGAAPGTDALQAALRAVLPGFAVPGTVIWRPDPLPRTATGKILKDTLRRELAG